MSPQTLLKAATRDAHERVDASFAAYDLADAGDYGRFLVRHAAAYLPVEEALTRAGAATLVDGWDDARRGPALIADLGDLALPVPEPVLPPRFDTQAQVLGGIYVLEGSRLGSAVLRKSVGPGLPRRFLDTGHVPGRWREVVAQLNRSLYEPQALEAAIDAAIGTFALFA